MVDGVRDGRSPGDRVVDALRVYSAGYADLVAALAQWLGVHTADAAAFAEVAAAEADGDPLTPVRLSRRIGLTSGATTSLLNRLERAGLVVRSREHADRRMVTLRASPDAGRAAHQVFGPVAGRVDEAMAGYPPELLRDVEGLLDHLSAVLGEATTELRSRGTGQDG